MRIYIPGEKSSALCHQDGRVSITYMFRAVPFRDGQGQAPNILVGVCDTCDATIIIPAQSTPAITQARDQIP